MTATETGVSRLGVLGGTFDPIHLGHLVAAAEALYRFELDRVLFLPAGRPWQKASYSDPEDRYLMTTLGIEGHGSFASSRIELDRTGPTYTADTLISLRDFYGADVSMYFIVGADTAANLGTWQKLDEIRDMAEFIAVNRTGTQLNEVKPGPGWPRIHKMDMPPIGISASDIRRRVRAGEPIDFQVVHAVATYIRSHGLYLGSTEEVAAS